MKSLTVKSLNYQGGWAVVFAWVAPLITSVIAFFMRKVVLSFLILTGIVVAIEFLTPVLIRIADKWFNISVPDLISQVPAAVWFYGSSFHLDYGIKVMVAAMATRFLIRRIPFIG